MYVEQIKKLAIENGSHNHISYPSDRFEGDLFTFINEDGKEETLEK